MWRGWDELKEDQEKSCMVVADLGKSVFIKRPYHGEPVGTELILVYVY